MDNATPPDSASSSSRGNTRSRRSWTVTCDSEAAEISSFDERPRTQAGEVADSPKAGPSSFSKLLNARRKRKERKNSQKQFEEVPPLPSSVVDQESRSNESQTTNSLASSSSVNESSMPPESETIQLLTDDSEPERYVASFLSWSAWWFLTSFAH